MEDDRKTAELIQIYLEREGFEVLRAADGRLALDLAHRERPNLVILDLNLPGLDGLSVCEALRSASDVPVIMVTARSTEDDTLLGLERGADDYVAKPFSPRELVARVRTVLRRSAGSADDPVARVTFGPLAVDSVCHEARVAGRLVRLTPREFRLLETLVREPGRAFSRQALLDRVCGVDYDGLDRTLDVHVMNLRKKIEPDPARPTYIQTVFGVGYKFCGAPDAP